MTIIQRTIQMLACGLCAMAITPTVLAQAKPGFYLGISGGKSSFDIDKSDLDRTFRYSISGTSTFEDSDSSIAFFGGYRFSSYFAAEVGYINLGTAEYRSTGKVQPLGFVVPLDATRNLDIRVSGVSASGIGSLPIGERFDLHARLGVFYSETELSTVTTVNSIQQRNDDRTANTTGALYGVGAGIHFGQHWSMSLDWTRYAGLTDTGYVDIENGDGFDVDALNVSGIFRF